MKFYSDPAKGLLSRSCLVISKPDTVSPKELHGMPCTISLN